MRRATAVAVMLLWAGSADNRPHAMVPPERPPWGALERLEYQPSFHADGWYAPNRAQGLRLKWHGRSLKVVERVGGAGLAQLTTTAFGRAGAVTPLPSVPFAVSARVERRFEGLTEWWENRPDGVEHGWTVHQEPTGSGPLTLAIEVEGATPEQDGEGAVLITAHGSRLSYGQLVAQDALARHLPSRLRVVGNSIEVEVDDRGARYPLVVDPLLRTSPWNVVSRQANANLGSAVAGVGDLDGNGYDDVVVAAERFDDGVNVDVGRVDVFLSGAAGPSSTPSATLLGTQAGALFGSAVAAAGDLNRDGFADFVVGEPSFDAPQGTNHGRVTVYRGAAGGLAGGQPWSTVSGQPGAQLGCSVGGALDLDGDGYDDVLAGACNLDSEGAVLVFRGGNGNPTPGPILRGAQAGSQFGVSVANAGDFNGDGIGDAVVGARAFNVAGGTNQGAALVFFGSRSAVSPTPNLTLSVGAQSSSFGERVAGAGDVDGDGFSDIIVGAPQYRPGGGQAGGAVFLFRGGQNPSTSSAWSYVSTQAGAQLGCAVSSAGDANADGYADVVVGARRASDATLAQVSLFVGGPNGLGFAPAWSTNAGVSELGAALANAGDVNADGFSDVLAGAPLYSELAFLAEGRAYLYLGTAAGLSLAPAWSTLGIEPGAAHGYSVSSAGDVNADGLSDVLVGAYGVNGNAGAAHLYLADPPSVRSVPEWTERGGNLGVQFGVVVARAGDLNGDGQGDVAVAANLFENGQQAEGAIFGFLSGVGSPGLGTAAWTLESNSANARLGFSVAAAGDVNRDGYGDLICGAPNFSSPGRVIDGQTWLIFGSASGLPQTVQTQAPSIDGGRFGYAASGAGDVNGDGYADVLVGAPNELAPSGIGEGKLYLYYGGPSGLPNQPSWTALNSLSPGAQLGAAVASADVNGDRFSDVVAGANGYNGRGAVFIYLGSPAGPDPMRPIIVEGQVARASFGEAVASAGDVNGDGFEDIVVGARSHDVPTVNAGAAFVFLGNAQGVDLSPAWTTLGTRPHELYGESVASAGDVNGDGFSDVLVGARGSPNGTTLDAGRASLFLGGDRTPGANRRLRQLNAGRGLAPGARVSGTVELLGRVTDAVGGGGLLRLEVEIKPLTAPFNAVQTLQSATTLGGRNASVSVSGLATGPYHWRARVRDGHLSGRWIPFGANSETESDFYYLGTDGGAGGGGAAGAGGGGTGGMGGGEAGGAGGGGGATAGNAGGNSGGGSSLSPNSFYGCTAVPTLEAWALALWGARQMVLLRRRPKK